ncbi:MAG: hypothetical protein HZB59_02100 [Ignavibacteriales bacterium]|nr:hypothetical protein [Ignavibacteriales bacterium]
MKIPRFQYYFILLILSANITIADVIKSGSMNAVSDGVNVTLRWVSENESNVISYEVLRSTNPQSGFIAIAALNPTGPAIYEFVDNTAFKKITTVYCYRIKVKFTTGESYFPALNEPPITVDHNVSGVRRTWGSIKAMFR